MRETKEDTLLIRLSKNEKKLLKSEAAKLKISVAELLRRQVLNGLNTTI